MPAIKYLLGILSLVFVASHGFEQTNKDLIMNLDQLEGFELIQNLEFFEDQRVQKALKYIQNETERDRV